MATHLKIVFVSWLLLLVLKEETKPVVAKGKRTLLLERVNILEKNVAEMQEILKTQGEKIHALEDCKGKRTLCLELILAYVNSYMLFMLQVKRGNSRFLLNCLTIFFH